MGLDNYVKMFTEDGRYYQALKVTFTYVFLSVPLKLGFALGVAMLLNRGLRGLELLPLDLLSAVAARRKRGGRHHVAAGLRL